MSEGMRLDTYALAAKRVKYLERIAATASNDLFLLAAQRAKGEARTKLEAIAAKLLRAVQVGEE